MTTEEMAAAAATETLQAEIMRLREQLTALQAETARLREENNALHQRVRVLTNDITYIGSSLLEEAQNRDWCSDYDYWAGNVNAHTSQPWLMPCSRTREAIFTVCIRGETTMDEEDFRSNCISALENIDPGDCDNVSVEVNLP